MLRDGLTNAQIAERMGISPDGAKYHVSEVMGKLGVGSRQEAALIRLEEYRPWWAAAFAPVAWLWHKTASVPVNASTLTTGASAALIVAAGGGLGLMAFLLLRDGGDGGSSGDPVATNDLADEFGASEVASDLDQALQADDEQFFVDNVLYEEVTCGDDIGPFGLPRGCAGLPAGSMAQGLPVSVLQSEGTYYDPAQYGELVQAMFKNGSPRLYAIGTQNGVYVPLRSDDFEETFIAIVADGPSSGEQELVEGTRAIGFALANDGDEWRIIHVTVGGTDAFLDYEEPGPDDAWVRDYFSAWERWETAN